MQRLRIGGGVVICGALSLMTACTSVVTGSDATKEMESAYDKGAQNGGAQAGYRSLADQLSSEYPETCGGSNYQKNFGYCLTAESAIAVGYYKAGDYEKALPYLQSATAHRWHQAGKSQGCYDLLSIQWSRDIVVVNGLFARYISARKSKNDGVAKELFPQVYTCSLGGLTSALKGDDTADSLFDDRNYLAAYRHFYPADADKWAVRYQREILVPLKGGVAYISSSMPKQMTTDDVPKWTAERKRLLDNASGYCAKKQFPLYLCAPLTKESLSL